MITPPLMPILIFNLDSVTVSLLSIAKNSLFTCVVVLVIIPCSLSTILILAYFAAFYTLIFIIMEVIHI